MRIDERFPYGEDRYQLVGRVEQRLFVVIYTPRQSVIRIILALKANLREIKHYESRTHND